MATNTYSPANALCPPSRTLIIRQTREIHQATSYSTSTSSQMSLTTSTASTRRQNKSGWEKAKMILCFQRPPSFPCLSAQRSFRGAVKGILYSNQSSALRTMKAPSKAELNIPEGASFDEMLAGETCSPIQLADFAAYLNAEGTLQNLRFLLWHRSHAQRFAQLAPEEMILHPPWTEHDHSRAILTLPYQIPVQPPQISPLSITSSMVSQKELSYHNKADSPYDSTRSSLANSENDKDDIMQEFELPKTLRPPPRGKPRASESIVPVQMAERPLDIKLVAPWDEPPLSVPAKLKFSYGLLIAENQHLPVSVDSLRADVTATLHKYNTLTYPLCLNALSLSPANAYLLSYAATRSLHPSSFFLATQHVEHILRNESYPRFLLSASTNANAARINAVLCSGAATLVAGLAVCVLAVVCGWHRELRIPGAVMAGMGAAVVFAGARGMCLILLTLGKAQDRPWGATHPAVGNGQEGPSESGEKDLEKGSKGVVSSSSKWMMQYKGRWLLSKVFLERERKVEARFVKEGQRVVWWQAFWIWALVSAGFCVVFLPIPQA